MTCTEVTEWMHRYLDHDLSQSEMIEMFRHIDDCPSCAEIFERLNLLSQQLEQLPDVKAPFSLVDSIMPRLDALDRSVREQEEEAALPPVVPFARSDKGLNSGKSSRGNSMAARTGIGAVAAAFILGIAIFNMPDKMPDAQVDSLMNSFTEETSSDGAQSSQLKQDTAAGNSANSAAGGTEAGSADQREASSEETQQPSEVPPTQEAAMESVVPDETPAARETDARSATQEAQKSTAPPVKKNQKTPPPTAEPRKTKTPSATDSPVVSADQYAAGDRNPAANESDPSSGDYDSDGAADRDMMELLPAAPSLMTSPASWTSPDERYEAVLENQHLNIYSTVPEAGQEGKQVLSSLPMQGTWVSGEWSADSRQFIYVTRQNGKNISEVYMLPAGQTATPAALETNPQATPDPAASATPAGTATSAPTATPGASPSASPAN
ncbi:anti-sigma factor family protein [Paenibacillus donghaensis]|uniref:Anti-sigma-W factor RsiW n=1 Tax=Paenibacillus donghaensis TaxID=414771 RepID=A0A2Z2KMA0_9BACL|nr:zf-HC2 domain-containing protein [Paenibacillus donghaensis]ASA23649.1 hypothetical protein B9T62_24360 [Paenibacillus donghaensis]